MGILKKVTVKTAVLALFAAFGLADAQSPCVSFESPLAGSVFSAPSCTVSLNITCDNVTKIDLQARYFPENSDSAVIGSLGTITRPPYKLIWNTSGIPNQLFTGIGILAEVVIGNTEVQAARQEGIFLTHNPIERKRVPIPYAVNVQKTGGETAQAFDLKSGQKSGHAVIMWNENGLVVSVRVNDNSFYINQPGRNIADAGLEILLDPTRKKAPHPAGSALFYVVPLSGSPYRIDYTADIADGAFKLVPQSAKINYPQTPPSLREFKGYDVQFTVPKAVFGKSIPDTLGCNIILRMLDTAGQVQKVSLNGGNIYEMYSPITWAEYYKLPKPLHMQAALQWTVFFMAGFLLALAAYTIITKMRKPQLLSNFERSEEEKRSFARVSSIIEQELVKKNTDIDIIAQRCEMEPQALNTLIKRNTGFTFINYLQYCRTEVAKERLRSSRSNEKSIADLCGFANALEMEKCFVKFHHITPYKFRTQQQVA